VARPDFPRSIVEFQGRFGDEEACRAYLFASRWPEGIAVGAAAGRRSGDRHRARSVWQCKACGKHLGTAGTVMHGTRTPLTLWFWAAYLVSTHTPGMSALQLQRQLGIKRYETAWLILHKLRRAMVAPERQPLTGEVEIDEAFVGGRDSQRRGGRQRDGKAVLVGVAVEVRGRGSGRVRLQVLPDARQATLGPWRGARSGDGGRAVAVRVRAWTAIVARHRAGVCGGHRVSGDRGQPGARSRHDREVSSAPPGRDR
jgi:hypothetical protein